MDHNPHWTEIKGKYFHFLDLLPSRTNCCYYPVRQCVSPKPLLILSQLISEGGTLLPNLMYYLTFLKVGLSCMLLSGYFYQALFLNRKALWGILAVTTASSIHAEQRHSSVQPSQMCSSSMAQEFVNPFFPQGRERICPMTQALALFKWKFIIIFFHPEKNPPWTPHKCLNACGFENGKLQLTHFKFGKVKCLKEDFLMANRRKKTVVDGVTIL